MTDFLQSKIPSPLELRAKLEELVRNDLLGPAGGPEEIVGERNVHDRYIVGRLAPRGQRILPDEQDDLAVGGSGDNEQDGKTEAGLWLKLSNGGYQLPSTWKPRMPARVKSPLIRSSRWAGKWPNTPAFTSGLWNSGHKPSVANTVLSTPKSPWPMGRPCSSPAPI